MFVTNCDKQETCIPDRNGVLNSEADHILTQARCAGPDAIAGYGPALLLLYGA